MRRVAEPLLKRLCADERGAALLLFTLLLVPLMTVVAVAVDLSRIVHAKQKLANAIDAAAIAVGRHPELSEADATTLAESFIRAHFTGGEGGSLIGFTLTAAASQIDLTATARVETTFLKMFQYDTVDVSVATQAMRQQRRAEVVMALDNSGSMAGTKIANLKTAANALVDILFGSHSESEYVKIGLVPFTAAVNVGADSLGRGWIDETGLSPLQREDINLPAGMTLLDLFAQLTNRSWGGCVRARTGPGGFDLTDEPPDPNVGETLFVPYFSPDEPQGYANDYLSDAHIPGSAEVKQADYTKYGGATVQTAPPRGPNNNCVVGQIQPLTNRKEVITSAIAAMQAVGNTVIPEGLAWGWRVLSQGPPFTEGAPYSDQATVKVLILLTDGENNVGGGGNGHNRSNYSAYGYAAKGHLGQSDGSQTRQVLDAKTATLCNNIKADKDGVLSDTDIYIYTISFQVRDSPTRTMLQNCASPPSECPAGQCYYDSPTATALEGAFANIALGINELRLAR